ncbi:hypothetical protein [Natrialba asiatica]|uniref:Uncharacterized protein n=1 Tax=Natrialba asiatica (strain ATCC 700177 / DSM 12278 / JCM 9576 / FERM P-10747 / NBRC 102637 / 172P1) TaxID=29540 RepID=M0AKH7_NATA1|nr:hypothetical protein [Natrialba asiatica]ELY97893.1 hypothetical protein C481_18195 [Natrialba asiatica DSM 12278]
MTGNENAVQRSLTGDVRLNGGEATPVELRGADDVYVRADAVDGRLTIFDPEYVFTDVPTEGEHVDRDDVRTVMAGDIEDGYVDRIDGDVLVTEAEDVFVEHGAAEHVSTVGAEQVFFDDAAAPTRSPDGYEVSVSGWQQRHSVRDPRNGVSIRGGKNELTVTDARHDLTVYVTGWGNDVRIEGQAIDATVYVVGRENRVSVGPYVTATIGAESGYDNELEADPLPPEALIETTREDAYGEAFFGRHKITYQEPAPDKEWCPNCGESADAVITRKQRDAFFLCSRPVRTYDSGDGAFECEHCTPFATGPVELSPDERKRILG